MISTTITLTDGVKIVTPNSLDLNTPYVLLEQQDWFEDEIKFLRRLLQPGQKAIDIGANYGVYTLSMARTVGSTGHIWAFEPASNTAKLLAEGVAANNFLHVVVEQSALSSACGVAQLSLNIDSELNALVHDTQSINASEVVKLTTLDESIERYNWQDIAFIKIDAEGEEANILRGGGRFFAEQSPLVQYEIKAGGNLNFELVRDFTALGYDSYRLVPGLNLLIPFDATLPPDEYLLNLFCCKQDCAERLAKQGYLVRSLAHLPSDETERLEVLLKKTKDPDLHGWEHTVANFPYGRQLSHLWKHTMREKSSIKVGNALSLYALSQDLSFSAMDRLGALEASLSLFKKICAQQPSYMRLASLGRVAKDYGARSFAIDVLTQLYTTFQEHPANLNEPFLAPGKSFDTIPLDKAMTNWPASATLGEIERLIAYSSFFSGLSALPRLKVIHALGLGDEEMERRLHLLRRRFGLPAS